MDNPELARVLYEIADILEIQEVKFKPQAYRNAARTVEALSADINEVYRQDRLEELPGIGEAIAKKISELLLTGHLKYLDELKKQVPIDFEALLAIPGIGPKKVVLFYKKLGIKDVPGLEKAAKAHLIQHLKGMGEKTESEILANIGFVRKSGERQLLGTVLPVADSIVSELRHLCRNITFAGSLRRMKETIGDVDILATTNKPQEVANAFVKLGEKVLAKGPTKCSVRMKNGLQADLRIIEDKSFGAALQYFTGSKEHNVALRQLAISKGFKLSEYGLFDRKDNFVVGDTEENVYKRIGLQYIEPELRENHGEIKAALDRKLPDLVSHDAIKGDLQVHSSWSDGIHTIKEIAEEAIKLGYEYIGISDHAGSLKVANSLDAKRVLEQRKEIESIRLPIRIFQGLEVNIRDDGTLDVPDSTLKHVDFVIAAIHSGFKNSPEKMTNRICKAIENPYATFISHPTGRVLNRRPPYAVDLQRVFDKAVEFNKFLEINAHPSRLDLNDINSRAAITRGLKLLINTDAHSKDSLSDMFYGVATARRGWCEPKHILNTLPLRQFEKVILKR
ncbi:MAG: DNA polymerase/3'-5' exonuclease PolX [Candidatus Woesearchaeota archaeon]